MKKLGAFFTDARVITAIGLIALALIIWFGGPYIKFGEDNSAPLSSEIARLVIIMILIVVWGLNNMRLQMNAKKADDTMFKAIEQTPSAPINANAPSQEATVLKNRFTEALTTLKKNKVFKQSGNAVYALPWYIIIGPPGSGKTSILKNSGLNFPLEKSMGNAQIQGIGGTRNCDWWFTDEAVLIDTAGRYTTQDSHKVEDAKAWMSFLDLLKKFRKRRPVNGVIVAFNLNDIANQTTEYRKQQATIVRERIQELTQTFNMQIPVYIMFTKCDLVAGFAEYFEDFGKDTREQIWGMTFSTHDTPAQTFAEEFKAMVVSLNKKLLHRMDQERNLHRRVKIQGFPKQLESMNAALYEFIEMAFDPNQYQGRPFLRGVYFTSALQEGTPIDRVMAQVSREYGITDQGDAQNTQQQRSFFINHLFKRLIFAEANIAGTDKRYERNMQIARYTGFAGLAAMILLALTIWTSSYSTNQTLLQQIQVATQDYNDYTVKLNPKTANLAITLKVLEKSKIISSIYDKKSHPWLVNLGLYDSDVDQNADEFYLTTLQTWFLPQLENQLMSNLVQGKLDDSAYITAFTNYLMFSDETHRNTDVMKKWYLLDWSKRFIQDEVTQDLLVTYIDDLLSRPLPNSEPNKQIVKAARQRISQMSDEQRLYTMLRHHPDFSGMIDLKQDVNGSVDQVFNIDSDKNVFMMPYIFTKAGFGKLDFDPESPMVASVMSNNWILGEDQPVLNETDRARIVQNTRDMYLREYAVVWQNFVEKLNIREVASLNESNEQLKSITDLVYSPVLSVLKIITDNTQLTPQVNLEGLSTLTTALSDPRKALAAKKGQEAYLQEHGTVVDLAFLPLHKQMQSGAQGKPADITFTITQFSLAQQFANKLLLSPALNEASYKQTRNRFEGKESPLNQLILSTVNQPEPVKKWAGQLSDHLWKLTLVQAYGYLNELWQDEVFKQCRESFEGRYPFSAQSSQEASLQEFADFFKKEGTEDLFVKTYLAPFINKKGKLEYIENRSIGMNSKTLQQMELADNIRKVYFRSSTGLPAVTFEMKPISMDNSLSSFSLDITGQQLEYSHGPRIPEDLTWPGAAADDTSRFTFENLNGSEYTKSFKGEWSFFKLLDQTQLRSSKKANRYRVKFTLNNYKAEFEIKAPSRDNPFSSRLINQYRCLEKL